MRTRVIPVLLLSDGELVKTVRFRNGRYIGDPLNAARLFNDMEVDEIIVLDMLATRDEGGPQLQLIEELATECFMPMCYGGGISSLEQMSNMLAAGVEKIALNSALLHQSELLAAASREFGSQSVVASIDVKKNFRGKQRVFDHSRGRATRWSPVDYLQRVQSEGAGEVLLNSVDRDGLMHGMDLDLIEAAAAVLDIPLVACGGAGSTQDLVAAAGAGADAVAAGSLFVYQGEARGILVNYPSQEQLASAFGEEWS